MANAESDQIVDISVTAADTDKLADITRELVQRHLVACGNIVSGVRSVYVWAGEINDDSESLVILHTRRSLVPAVIDYVEAVHPDETPQIIATEAVEVHPGYRQWVLDSTRQAG
ncbi:MAG: divalent-cation tolerance protein CutA [Nocardia sp.]|nr:divalent-cation tolerance protein CutA [Nocardia sp.]